MSRSIWHLALTSIAVALSPLTAVEWHRIQPNEKSVSVFEIDPHHPGGLYAVAGDELLWSPNRGDEWVSLLDIDVFVDGQGHIQAFAVDQHDPQALYLGIRTTQPYLLKSDDRGYTWTLMDFSGDWFYHLGSDPHHPGALFAATDEGVLKSRDAGDSWTHLYSGPPGYYGHYNDLLIHSLQPDLLFLSAGHCSCNTYLFRSRDGGTSWQSSTNGLPVGDLIVDTFAADPSEPAVMYTAGVPGGIFRSDNQGSSWNYAGLRGGNIRTVAIDPHNEGVLLAGSGPKSHLGGGIFRTVDGGNNWTRIHDIQPGKIAFDPQAPGIAYASIRPSQEHGLYRAEFEQPTTSVESTSWGSLKRGLPD